MAEILYTLCFAKVFMDGSESLDAGLSHNTGEAVTEVVMGN